MFRVLDPVRADVFNSSRLYCVKLMLRMEK